MKFNRFVLLLALPLYFLSCKPQQKLPSYLDKMPDSTGKGTVTIPELTIQKNDLLSIQIFSLSTKPETSDAIYNQPASGGEGGTAGYLVDINGNIYHHRLGVFQAAGKTKQALADEIKKRLTEPVELLKDPTVVIRFQNFKVTVLGQVGREGIINVPGEKITILEAVGLAGGITDYGRKNRLRVLREINGTRETGSIDLSTEEIFESPYYYLAQNDVIIVEANDQKQKEQEEIKTYRKISFALTLVTVTATLANIFIRN